MVYLEALFGPDIYQFFTPEYINQMSQFLYSSEAKCIIEEPDDPDYLSIDSNEHILSA